MSCKNKKESIKTKSAIENAKHSNAVKSEKYIVQSCQADKKQNISHKKSENY